MAKDCSCCADGDAHSTRIIGDLTRPRYSPGLILEDKDLTAAVDYTRQLNQLLFGSLFGCGVVCGLTLKVDGECGLKITVAPGLALDGCGTPLHLTNPAVFSFDKRYGTPATAAERQQGPKVRDFWILACAGEKLCEPRSLVCDEDSLDGAVQATRFRSAVDVRLSCEPPGCTCGCALPDKDWPTDTRDLDTLAWRLLDGKTCDDPDQYPCNAADEARVGCVDDCGCSGACGCGCCVLLGWVHWLDGRTIKGNDGKPVEIPAGWVVLHDRVRRFIRPKLLADPMCGTDAAQLRPAPAQNVPQQPTIARTTTLQRIEALEQRLGSADKPGSVATIDDRLAALEKVDLDKRLTAVEAAAGPAPATPAKPAPAKPAPAKPAPAKPGT